MTDLNKIAMPKGWGTLLATLALVLAACGGPQDSIIVGGVAPDFSLEALAGDTVDLASLEGRPAVIAFWATWCQPCVAEIPVLNALADNAQVAVLGIALDEGGRPIVERFVDARGVRYPVALGNAEVFTRYDGFAIPHTVVLDATGSIVAIHRGPVTQAVLERELGLS